MKWIPLVRAKHLKPFAEVLAERGAPVERLLSGERLPPYILEETDSLIPSERFRAFCDRAARSEGIRNLGLLAGGRYGIRDLGRFGRIIGSKPALLSALRVCCQLVGAESSNVRPSLAVMNRDVRFAFESHLSPGGSHFQNDLYRILTMLKVVWLASPGWRPGRIYLEGREPPEWNADLAEQLGGAEVRFGAGFSGFFIPRWKMALRVSPDGLPEVSNGPPGGEDAQEILSDAPALDFAGSLRQMLETYRRNTWPSIHEAAEFAGMSARTLQRRLAEENQNYSGLIDRLRFEAAIPLVQDPRNKMIDIALELGFSNSANLTRAFRRWAGVTPGEFRQDRKSAPAD